MRVGWWNALLSIGLFLSSVAVVQAGIQPVAVQSPQGVHVEIRDGQRAVFTPIQGQSSLLVTQPTGTTGVLYRESAVRDGELHVSGGAAPGLVVAETYRNITPDLIERTVTVTAESDQRYYLELGWTDAAGGEFYSFLGPEKATKRYSPTCSGPEFAEHSMQTFPLSRLARGPNALRHSGRFARRMGESLLYGVQSAGTPPLTDQRRRLAAPRHRHSGSRSTPRASIDRPSTDGNTSSGADADVEDLAFCSPVRSLYDVQLAAHLALANAKGFNRSGLEAILRNTSYLFCAAICCGRRAITCSSRASDTAGSSGSATVSG